MFLYLIAFYCTGRLYGTSKQQEFFRQRCFTRIRVTDDGECSSLLYFVVIFHIRIPKGEY